MIDSSTIDPAVSKDVANLVSNAGATYIDAPVSGGSVLYLQLFSRLNDQYYYLES